MGTWSHGRRQVVRNGSMPEREVVTGIGPIKVQQPRVHDRRTPGEGRETFTSAILPPYLRKTRSMEDLIPWLYLKATHSADILHGVTPDGPRIQKQDRRVLNAETFAHCVNLPAVSREKPSPLKVFSPKRHVHDCRS